MQNEGPTPKPLQYTCNGCKHLKTEDWEDEDGRDIDFGIRADCILTGKKLAMYYREFDSTPNWCPLLPETTDAK